MKCPKCDKETIYNNTEVEIFKLEEMESYWPVKISCQCKITFRCSNCDTLITGTEMRDYIPVKLDEKGENNEMPKV